MTENTEKKPRKKTPAYKSVERTGGFDAVSDAFSALTELGDECQEIVDNAVDGLRETQRIQTFEGTASTLTGLSEPDLPECLSSLELTYYESVPTNKRRSASRAVRCANAADIFTSAAAEAETLLEDSRDKWEAWQEFEELDDDEKAEKREAGEVPEEPQIKEDDELEVETFISECNDIASEVEGCEFPGMYG